MTARAQFATEAGQAAWSGLGSATRGIMCAGRRVVGKSGGWETEMDRLSESGAIAGSKELWTCRAAVAPLPRTAPPRPDGRASLSPDPASPAAWDPRGCSSPFPRRASLRRGLRPRENAATLLRGARAPALALAALAVLALAVPELAAAQTVTLVSNTGQADASDRSPGLFDYAQPFNTGSNSGGYNLAGIVLDFGAAPTGTGTLTITVRENSSGNPSGTVLYTLTNPTFLAGLNEFLAPLNAELVANTRYWVMASYSADSGGPDWERTQRSNGLDTGAAAGWAIDGSHRFATRGSTVWTGSGSILFQIAVKGSATPNNAPVFADATASRSFTETVGDAAVTLQGEVGAVVTATDADDDSLTYTLEGTDAAKFYIVEDTGQIRTDFNQKYDREAKASYSVTVKADDGNGGTDTIMVTISVDNAVEKPVAPAIPTVTATSGSTTSLDVSWMAPANTGRPAITGYKVEYRAGVSGNWINHAHTGTGTTATIASLTAATAYQVQVLAVNSDGDGAWSGPGAGTTGTPISTAATGKPGITGTAQVGWTLTATVGTIADVDGLPVAGAPDPFFSAATTTVQWIQVDGVNESDISGATSETYTLVTADAGKKIKVKVSFEDEGGTEEGPLTSDAYPSSGTVQASGTPVSGVLVSNVGQGGSHYTSLSLNDVAQRFTTGTNATGYTLTSIELTLNSDNSTNTPTVKLHSASATGTEVATLTGPAMLGSGARNYTFTPSSTVTLRRLTTYWVVAEGDAGWETTISSEDATPAPGWEIGDYAESRAPSSTGSFASTNSPTPLKIRVNGTFGGVVLSSDATLSALALEDAADDSAIAISPVFASGTTSYTASVGNGVDEITIEPTVNESNATVEYLDSTDTAITDANSGKTGQQVSLDVGANTIKVKVTAQDATTDTYTVVVTRALAGQVFVDNTGEATLAGNIQTNNSNSQSFATGPNTGGYILTSISVVAESSGSGQTFSLAVHTTDTNGAPVAPHASMIAPGDFPAGESTITFAAPPNTMLDGGTTYTIILGQVGSNPRRISTTTSDADNAGTSGWSIGDSYHFTIGGPWSLSTSGRSVKIAIRGTIVGGVTNHAATGEPAISGTARARQALTATTGSIADQDGLPSMFTYQWVRVDADGAANPLDISGAESATYILTDDDVGKRVKVKVSFTDNLNGKEERTSAAYPAAGVVATADGATALPEMVPADWALKPADISAGGQFRLMFISSTTRDATSTNIADYNTFVSTRAAAGVTAMRTYANDFTALVSTDSVNARANTLTRATEPDAPIYWVRSGSVVAGDRATDDYADFYDASWKTGAQGRNESGRDVILGGAPFWTGTNTDGTTHATGFMGATGFAATVETWQATTGGIFAGSAVVMHEQRIVGLSPVFQVAGGTTSSDATLSALALEDAADDATITISPVFVSGTTSYTASVNNDVDEITVEPTVNESNATVEYLDSTDTAIADANSGKTGQQVSLDVGANTIKVKVTAQDATTDTYTVVVTRALAMQTVVTFISNSAQLDANRSSIFIRATAFTTGGNSAGYELSSVDIYVPYFVSSSTIPRVEIYEDSGSDPGTLHATLNNPSSYQPSANTFNAPRNTTLRAGTTYWLVTSNSAAANGQNFLVSTGSATADTGSAAGWSIGNARSKTIITDTLWTLTTDRIIFAVKGTATGGTATNTAAAGAPTITGTAQVGQTLTAVTTGITDADGLTSPTYTYQWIRVDGTEADIAGANSSTYTLDDADLDKTIRVRVSFDDDEGNSETLISRVYPTSGTVQANNALVSNLGQSRTNAFRLALSDLAQAFTTGANPAGYTLSSIDLKLDSSDSTNTPTVKLYSGSANGMEEAAFTGPAMLDASTVKNYAFAPSSTVILLGSTTYWVVAEGAVRWVLGGTGEDATPAMGWSIANNYEYRVATLSTGGFTTDSAGEVLQIRVNGTTGGVVTNTAPTAANNTVTTAEDRPYTFAADDFGFMDADAGAALASVKIVTPPALGTLALDGTAVTANDVVVWDDIEDDKLTFTPARDAHGAPYTTFTFKVNDGTDDSADAYTMTIDVTDALAPVCAAPSFGGRREIWSGTVTVEQGENVGLAYYGFDEVLSNGTLLPSQSFFTGSNNYVIDALLVRVNGALEISFAGNVILTLGELNALRMHVCDGDYDFSTSSESQNTTIWLTTLDWSPPVVTRTVYLSLPGNNAATGEPAISGTATAGQVLTATTGTIADADGLPSSFTYQWLRVDAAGTSNEEDISGEIAATYTLTDDDVGKRIKVKVSFTDDLSGEETRTSAAYPSSGTVTAASTTNTAPTAADNTVTTGEDRPYAFTADDFEFDDTDTGDTLASVTIVTPPALGTLALDGTAVMADDVVTEAQIDADMLTFRPAQDAHGAPYTTFTFKVNDGTVDSAEAYTMTIDVTDAPAPVCAMPNFAGEGRRQIWTGTVTVAQIYIPFTTIINGYGFELPTSDTLGSSLLPSRAFSIGSHNYTITAIAVGISGKVVFTTDSNDIALTTAEADVLRLHLCDESFDFMAIAVQDETSYRWDASLDWSHPVVTRTVYLSLPTNHAATGEPAITGTAQVGQELTADASPIMDDNGLPSIFTYQWLRVDADGTSNEEDITGETDATYTLTDDDLGKKVKVKVSFVDILGSNEQRTSAPTATVIGLNSAPVFSQTTQARSIAENTAAGQNVGAAVTATDADADDNLTYMLGGADMASFDFVGTTGQIRTKSGVSYDFEAKSSYTVTVTATDNSNATAVATVTISVTDVDEPPSAPATPMVSAVSGSTTRLSVSWAAPANAGKPAIANYDVQYRAGSSGTWTDGPEDVATTTATITSLVANTLYEARVRATNAEGDSGWSEPPGSGRTNTPSNNAPVFDPAMPEREIAENTAAGQNVGAAVTATDADAGDTLGYTLGGADVASFDFVETTGQIRTKTNVSYDFEAKSSYAVTVTASDGTATAVASVTISVTDVDEPPSAPATPMVSAVSGSTTRLSVSWAAPANAGKPAIANYDVQYRVGSSGTWSDGPEDVTGTTTAVSGLVADTLYEARVRASNAEGDSGWSDPPGSGRTNAPTNNAPVFSPAMPEREIAENTAAGQNVGAAVTATDADAGDNLTYMLGGADMASFDFVGTTGQIRTKSGVSYDFEAKSSYTVTVTATDNSNATAVATVTISVTDVDEPPSAPATPMVSAVSGSTTRLSVSWAAPANAGKPAIANYDVQYRVGSSGAWTDGPQDVTGTTATIASLVADTLYEARVRASNAEGDSGWSDPPGSGRTNAATNNAPVFSPAMPEREIAENTAAGVNVGAPVTATDADAGDTLSYTLGGADVASFDFVETTGQIRTKAGVSYDHEAKSSYTVTVTASDGTATADASVTIRVTDVDEPPSAPATPMVSAVSGSTTRLSVSWAAPANAGKPAIANYDVQYRVGSSGTWSDGPEDVAGTSTTIASLVANTNYEARVRATNAEGDSGWSDPPGSGRTNAPSNNAPVFDPAMPEREIAENTAAGQNVGAAVTATDADAGDNLTYMLGGADMASFDFVETTGQIRTKSGVSYDHEAKSSYTVTVTASDGTATADASVTIRVTDVDEPPNAPATPTVSAVSGSTTSLSVSWAAPANAGKPAIANYDVQYRVGSSGAWTDGPQDVTGTTTIITGLATDTAYQARVRATNAEGDSGWSAPPGSGRTNAPSTSVPGAPGNLRTAPGDGRVTLAWTAPGNDGGAGIEKYRYRVRPTGARAGTRTGPTCPTDRTRATARRTRRPSPCPV